MGLSGIAVFPLDSSYFRRILFFSQVRRQISVQKIKILFPKTTILAHNGKSEIEAERRGKRIRKANPLAKSVLEEFCRFGSNIFYLVVDAFSVIESFM